MSDDRNSEAQSPSQYGMARKQEWFADDGWLIGYATSRIVGGPHDGKFATWADKPVGKGSRGDWKTAQQWERVYFRGFTKRKTAKARALALYAQHSPEWTAPNGGTES